MKKDFPTTSLATVYKTVTLLKELSELGSGHLAREMVERRLSSHFIGFGSHFEGARPDGGRPGMDFDHPDPLGLHSFNLVQVGLMARDVGGQVVDVEGREPFFKELVSRTFQVVGCDVVDDDAFRCPEVHDGLDRGFVDDAAIQVEGAVDVDGLKEDGDRPG